MTLIDRPALTLVGHYVRTSHDRAHLDIGPLWGRAGALLQEGEPAYAAYYDYANDGASYCAFVGIAVPPDAATPDGLTRLDVPAGRCQADVVVPGTVEAIRAYWSQLQTAWPTGPRRAYGFDIETWRGPMGTGTVEVSVTVRAD